LILGVAASVTANVLHARDNHISQDIAAWPSLALLLTAKPTATARKRRSSAMGEAVNTVAALWSRT
jgi:hypothetical protein